MKKYVHYGHAMFADELFKEVKNEPHFTKPFGGLWASPLDAKYGWKQWNQKEHFRHCSKNKCFIFELKDDANIFHIYSKKDALKLPIICDSLTNWICLDFECIKKNGIDGIEIHFSEEAETSMFDSLYFSMYGWDCDSILILNKNVIKAEE